MKDKLQTGDVILQSGIGRNWLEKVFVKVANWKTKSKVTHGGLYLGNGLMVESYWVGVKIHPIYDYRPEEVDYYRYKKCKNCVSLTDKDKKFILRNAYKYEGTKYDFLHVFLNLFKGILHWIPYDSKHKVYCFEFIARVYEESGLSLNDGTFTKWDLDYITGYELSHTKKLRRLEI